MICLAEPLFTSIQGEGIKAGMLSTFVRVSGCNLSCHWGESSCDTEYAISRKENNPYSLDELIRRIRIPKATEVVITGGEPMAPWNREPVLQLAEKLSYKGFSITIETNGTFPLPKKDLLYSISPKVGMRFKESGKCVGLSDLCLPEIGQEYQIKMPVSTSTNYRELTDLMSTFPVDTCSFFLMPVGKTPAELNHNAKKCMNWLALNPKLRYSDRLQIRLWGNKRGV